MDGVDGTKNAQTRHPDESPAVIVENLTVSMGGHVILDRIHLRVDHKDFLGIIGPNGGGKTTLLKTIVGLVQPDKGTVRIYGRPPRAARRRVGYVPQHTENDSRFPVSVRDVVLMGRVKKRGLFHRLNTEDKETAERVLKQVDMWTLRNRQIGELSGGQKQRVLIARALSTNPDLLVLDEPAAALDTTVGKSLYGLLTRLNEHITIIMVTHDMGVVARSVTSVACLSRKLFSHDDVKKVDPAVLEKTYGCPIDIIAHGSFPHRVFGPHRAERTLNSSATGDSSATGERAAKNETSGIAAADAETRTAEEE